MSELSFDGGSGSSKTTPDTVRAKKKRPAASPEELKVSGTSNNKSTFPDERCSSQKNLKLPNTTPLKEIRNQIKKSN